MVRPPLPYLGDNLLMLADLRSELGRHSLGFTGPLLLRASEANKLARILAHGTDRGGYPGDRRWRHDPRLAHVDVILATTPAQNEAAEADPGRSSSLKKFTIIDEPLLLIYAAHAFEQLRPTEFRFRQSDAKLAALLAVIPITKLALPDGWFRPDEGIAYRGLVERALMAPSRGQIVEVGCWLGRSTSYIAGACRARGAELRDGSDPQPGARPTLTCVDTWAGSSDRFDLAYRERLAARDIEAEFRSHLAALGLDATCLRLPSVAAANTFARESVDLVFLDGSHDQPAVAADITAWLPRIRSGGILAGHDFSDDHPGVVAAVEHAAATLDRPIQRGPGSLWWMQP
ncbi:class I SAM-dependent methyltransferase [Enhygromyxa salina]|uniref:class I SAM-dependent methyltransferase n=1 Tax=Enhygromyxa salina TaxID=215803 RepID=UPI0011BAD23C|nr:class I SAM-dependent methyltransferase [Enhygromyxa salina]